MQPYKIGDRFQVLGCGPHAITAVIQLGDSFEYTAEYVGREGDAYWKWDAYSHSSIVINNNLKN